MAMAMKGEKYLQVLEELGTSRSPVIPFNYSTGLFPLITVLSLSPTSWSHPILPPFTFLAYYFPHESSEKINSTYLSLSKNPISDSVLLMI